MKTIAVVIAIALSVACATGGGATPAVAQTVETYEPHRSMWVAKRANVRAGPSTNFVKTGLLEVGERVTVVAKTGDWFQLSRRAG